MRKKLHVLIPAKSLVPQFTAWKRRATYFNHSACNFLGNKQMFKEGGLQTNYQPIKGTKLVASLQTEDDGCVPETIMHTYIHTLCNELLHGDLIPADCKHFPEVAADSGAGAGPGRPSEPAALGLWHPGELLHPFNFLSPNTIPWFLVVINHTHSPS